MQPLALQEADKQQESTLRLELALIATLIQALKFIKTMTTGLPMLAALTHRQPILLAALMARVATRLVTFTLLLPLSMLMSKPMARTRAMYK